MNLEDLMDLPKASDVHALIKRRRRQMIIHACIYYKFNNNIISDHHYDHWARELADLQSRHPEYSDEWDEYFEDWDGSTGFQLPIHIPRITARAQWILDLYESGVYKDL